MDSAAWDAKYSRSDLVYGAPPNQTVVEHTTSLPRGRALDLAAGQGRNAIWLATRGWTVDAVDFSSVALERAREIADASPRSVRERLTWVHADVTELATEPNYDLVLVLYLHLPQEGRRAAIDAAVRALKPDGVLMILGHHSDNIRDGVGGPQDPEILYTPEDLVSDIGDRLDVTVAETLMRVTNYGIAMDSLLLAGKSGLGSWPDRE